jgi:hypothetical protein
MNICNCEINNEAKIYDEIEIVSMEPESKNSIKNLAEQS